MVFEWDEGKNKKNRKKHGLWFEEVKSVFDDPLAKVFLNDSNSDQEERFIIGRNVFGLVL